MEKMINYFRAMGEETRVKVITMLLKEEMCICELIEELGLSQSAVSHHVKILKQAELVNDRRQGKWTFYSINKAGFERAIKNFQSEVITPLAQYEYRQKDNPRIECLS